jgi:hypothetical protein
MRGRDKHKGKTGRPAQKAVPIIDAKTMVEFIKSVNADYGLNIPESWPEGSVLAGIWALPITVTAIIDGYTATATIDFPTLGLPTTGLSGRFSATVTGGGDFHLRNAVGVERLTLDDLNQLNKET